MNEEMIKKLLSNYTALITRIDQHIAVLQKKYPDQIACKKGCDDCCKKLSLFPVEAFCLSLAYKKIDHNTQQQIKQRIETTPANCPLLIGHTCALYRQRPVICRTHGYPIALEKSGKLTIDFCPDNFKGIDGFAKEDILSLEQLNTTLLAVNQHFLAAIETDPPLPDRIDAADALFLL